MKVTELNEGKKIAYAVKKTVLTLDGGRIALDLQKYQKDYPVTLDFMTDGEGNMLMNAFDSLRAYVAEIRLPAYETETVEVEDEDAKDSTEEAAEDTTPAEAVDGGEDSREQSEDDSGRLAAEEEQTVIYKRLPLDMDKVVLRLWCVEPLYINQFGDAE